MIVEQARSLQARKVESLVQLPFPVDSLVLITNADSRCRIVGGVRSGDHKLMDHVGKNANRLRIEISWLLEQLES